MKPLIKIAFVFIYSCINSGYGQSFEYELNSDWKFRQEGKSEWKKANVPGVAHLDLLNNNMIDDPYWENNELKQRWIEEENWIYVNHILFDPAEYNTDNIELVFE